MHIALTRVAALALFFALVAAPTPAYAWGYEAHWFIMDRAIALLPAPLRPLFEKHRALVVQRVIDPDTWRNAGFEEEYPNHFLDLDWEGFGKDPYRELPRDFTAALAKFGRARIQENRQAAVAHRGDVRRPPARVRKPGPARRVRSVRRGDGVGVAGALRLGRASSHSTPWRTTMAS